MNKEAYEKKLKSLKKYECNYFLKKNGRIKYFIDINFRYKRYICILKDILKFDVFRYEIIGKNEDDLIQNLLFLYYLKTQNLKCIIFKENSTIAVFKEKNIDSFLNVLFFSKLIDNHKLILNNSEFINNKIETKNKTKNKKSSDNNKLINLLKLLSIQFLFYKLKYTKISNQKVLIYIFYEVYIYELEKELKKKFNYTLNSLENYKSLYIFLKENGYVDIFYNNYAPLIIKNSNKIFKYIISHPDLLSFKQKNKSLIVNFSKINLNYLIDKKIIQSFNKKYIKNKFLELIKK